MSDDDFLGPPPIGHNQPPLIERVRELVDNCNRWVTERPVIADQEQAGKASEFIEQLRLARDDISKAVKEEREPHDKAIIEIRARYFHSSESVGVALVKMEAIARYWLQREKDRLEELEKVRRAAAEKARQEAEEARAKALQSSTVDDEVEARRAAERAAELAQQADALPDRARIKGDLSSRAMSLRATWKARIVDEAKALKYFAKHPAIRAAALEAIAKLARDHAKQAKDPAKAPPGIEFFIDVKAV